MLLNSFLENRQNLWRQNDILAISVSLKGFTMKALRFLLIAATLALGACAGRFTHGVEYAQWLGLPTDVPVFLAYNVRVGLKNDVSPVNQQQSGRLMPFGTEVRILRAKEGEIVVKVVGSGELLHLRNDKSETLINDSAAFTAMLSSSNRSSLCEGIDPKILAEIEKGQVIIGMTRSEVVLSQGPPLKGRTPTMDSDTWTYRITEGKLRRLVFKDGKVVHIYE